MDTEVATCEVVGATASELLPEGARVLDFGSGPCDKSAVLQEMGYQCAAYDDFKDPWHLVEGNKAKILEFARAAGIDLQVAGPGGFPWPFASFDMVLVLSVIEHLHDSPRELLESLTALLEPGGFLVVTVPNAVNVRKRIDVLRGKTNLPPYSEYYRESPWRGHVREYVKDDLRQLTGFLGMDEVELRSYHSMLHKLPKEAIRPYRALTTLFPGWRDSWLVVMQKPMGPGVTATT